MNNRSKNRYFRRKERREEKKNRIGFEDIFTAAHLWTSAKYCYRNVGWKTSTKNFKRHLLEEVSSALTQVYGNKSRKFKATKFVIHNRGKDRIVSSIEIRERMIQKCFCDYCLTPVLSRSLIMDNSATQKGKGTDFAIKRMKDKYREFMKKYSETGYILTVDFHDYFNSIDHDILYKKIKPYLDERCFGFYGDIVDRSKGLDIGAQVSQISAVFFCNDYDYLAQSLCFGYGRYMDDSVFLFRSKEEMNSALPKIRNKIDELKLTVNEKKWRISKARDGFVFLKKRFVKKGGKILIIPKKDQDRIIKQRIKKWKKVLVAVKGENGKTLLDENGKIVMRHLTRRDVLPSYQGWRASKIKYNMRKRVESIDKYFNEMFPYDE